MKMKKSQILVLSTALLVLVGCQQGGGGSDTSSSGGSILDSTDSTTSSSQEGSSSSQSTSSMNQSQALALFREALNKDYSNVSLYSYQSYNDGEAEENDYEFIADGYIAEYAYDLAAAGTDPEDCYIFYHVDEQKKSWQYFEKKANIEKSKSGWLNKGARNADLSIWKTYFYLPALLENITTDDISYSNGLYYVNSSAKVEELKDVAFEYAWYNDIVDISFSLSEDGYISKIWGFCDSSSDPVNYVAIQLFDFGTTVLPNAFNSVLPFSEETKLEYWQYVGWEQDYQRAYYTDIHASLVTQDVVSDETYDAIIDVDKKIEIAYTLSPETFNPWDLMEEEDMKVTWHYDKTILEMTSAFKKGTFRGIGDGETEIYVTVNGENGPLESEHIKVKVNGLKEQDKTGAVYDFLFTSLTREGEVGHEYYTVGKTNLVQDSKALSTITAGLNVELGDGKNAEYDNYYKEGQQYLKLRVRGQEAMKNDRGADLFFDFGEQQVSSISFNYGLFFSSHAQNLNWSFDSFKIRTYNDASDVQEFEMADYIKENISAEFVKNLELEFEPANHVEIVAHSSMVGGALDIAVDSFCFKANEKCNMYIPPEDVEVESVSVTSSLDSVYVGKTTQLSATINPENAFDQTLTWHVEEGKEDVVSLVENGSIATVTGLKAGTAEVWATAANGVQSNKVTITVEAVPDFTAHVGKIFKDEERENTLEIIDAESAKFTFFRGTIEAKIVDYKNNVFTLENEQGETYTVEFTTSGNRADVDNIKYLSNGELKDEDGTRYCDYVPNMTGFSLTMGGATVSETETYEAQIGDLKWLTPKVTPDGPDGAQYSMTYTSSDATKATVSESGEISFLASGDVVITAVATDVYGEAKTKEVHFHVSAKVFPTEDNWEISADKSLDAVTVGNQLTFSVNWLDESINTSKEVEWSVDDSELASIGRTTGAFTAKGEGTVVVTAKVTGENGTITKTKTIVIGQASGLADEIVGEWKGYDDSGFSFTFTVNSNGTAVLKAETGTSWNFTYDSYKSSEYLFVHDGDNSVKIGIHNLVNFYLYDESGVINDYVSGDEPVEFYMFNEYVEVEKQ